MLKDITAIHYLLEIGTQVFLHALQGSKQNKGIFKVKFNAVCYNLKTQAYL